MVFGRGKIARRHGSFGRLELSLQGFARIIACLADAWEDNQHRSYDPGAKNASRRDAAQPRLNTAPTVFPASY